MPGPAPTYQPTFTPEQLAECQRVVRQHSAPQAQVGERAGELRNRAVPRPGEALELVLALAVGEPLGEGELVRAEQVNPETIAPRERGVAARPVPDRDEAQPDPELPTT